MNRHGDRHFMDKGDKQRSVFVGNISYEVTEEQLKDVFSKVGQVVHMRLVYDRETGKPKGYGFCEFADIKSAESAIKFLNGHELNGRTLRVDSSAGDSSFGNRGGDEGHATQNQPPQPEESPYGPECEQGRAPESISRTVNSLGPEKMFELMKQMKAIVLTNPSEAKNMLISNPQLAYALLQAQVVMRIVDPQVAMTMLHRADQVGTNHPVPFHQTTPSMGPPSGPPQFAHPPAVRPLPGPPPAAAPSYGLPPMGMPPPSGPFSAPPPNFSMPPPMHPYGAPPPGYGGPPPQGVKGSGGAPSNDFSDADMDNAELLVQVLNLSQEEIDLLPDEDRQKILALRMQLRSAQ